MSYVVDKASGNTNGKNLEWAWRIGTILVSILLAWGVLAGRVSVLESEMEDVKEDVRYIRQRIDAALAK